MKSVSRINDFKISQDTKLPYFKIRLNTNPRPFLTTLFPTKGQKRHLKAQVLFSPKEIKSTKMLH